MTAPLGRRLLAEGLGAAFLLMAVVGSGIMAERLAGGSVALALLANALATVAMLAVLILLLAPVSGAHLNPAVSVAMAATGRLPWRALLPYAGAQVAGAVIGVVLAHAMFDLPLLQAGAPVRTGFGQWLGEAVATFALVLVVLGLAGRSLATVAAAVALTIGAAYWFTSSTSFANPAVTVARALTASFAGIAPASAPAFIAAQFAGMAAAVAVARLLLRPVTPALPASRGG